MSAIPTTGLATQARPLAPAAKPKKSFLANVTSGAVKSPGFMLIYGLPGIGKSTFAADAPKAIFIDTELGSTRLNVARMPNVESWDDVKGALAELANEDHPYQTLVIDTVDGLEGWINAHVCKMANKPNLSAIPYNKGPDVALDEWRTLVSLIERIQRTRNMRVVLVGHSVVRSFKNPEGEPYDYYTPKLNEKAAGWLVERCDTVLFARQQVYVKADKGERARGISTGVHVIHTARNAAYVAKNRDHLPEVLPLDWSAYVAAVERQAPADLGIILAEIESLAAQTSEKIQSAVRQDVDAAGSDAARLMRVLNRLRATVNSAETESAQ